MGKKNKLAGNRRDKWWQLAKEQGYRARSAFKLIQLNKKYNFLASSKAVLDLCAAPGGWLQVAVKHMPPGSTVLGVDLLPIRGIPGVNTLQEDINTPRCRQWLKKQLKVNKLDVVLHDGAPNVGGSTWLKDAFVQNELVLCSLRLAVEFMRPGGLFITKVFRSQDYNALLWVMKQFFTKTEVTKPVASRNSSAEIYVVCSGFLAPKKIDARLLDPKHVFKQVESTKAAPDVFHEKIRKTTRRHRQGYEEGVMLVHKQAPVLQFLDSAEPIQELGTYNRFLFDKSSALFAAHADTTEEIRTLCKDLRVLGKGDFKHLLKWRLRMRAFRKQLEEEAAADQSESSDAMDEDEVDAGDGSESSDDEDEKLALELDGLQQQHVKRLKNAKRKRKEKRMRAKRRMALAGVSTDGIAETQDEQGLFSMGAIRDKATLKALDGPDDGPADLPLSESSDEDEEEMDVDDESDLSDSVARHRKLERDLDSMYSEYKKRRGVVSHRDGKRNKQVGLSGEQMDAGLENLAAKIVRKGTRGSQDVAEEAAGDNPLLVAMGMKEPSARQRAKRWFGRDAFAELDSDDDAAPAETLGKRKAPGHSPEVSDGEDDSAEDMPQALEAAQAPSHSGAGPRAMTVYSSDEDDSDSVDDSDSDGGRTNNKAGFEEVPLEEYSDDSDARAEALAMGHLMIRKKTREHLLDSSYNRYAFNDREELPDWFAEDEEKHNKAQMPVTKDQMTAMKAQLKAIDARPIAKVAEAKGRKKIKAMKRLERAKQQANTIAETDHMSASEKLKAIQKLYQRSKAKKKTQERVYVVAKKAGTVRPRGARGKKVPYKMVDKRMKSDKRAEARAEKKKRGRSKSAKRRRKA